MVSLWDLLIAVCCSMAVGGALASARVARVGFSGYVSAIIVGMAVGLGCAYLMTIVGKTVSARQKEVSLSNRERSLLTLYLAAIVWIFFAACLGFCASLALLWHSSG